MKEPGVSEKRPHSIHLTELLPATLCEPIMRGNNDAFVLGPFHSNLDWSGLSAFSVFIPTRKRSVKPPQDPNSQTW